MVITHVTNSEIWFLGSQIIPNIFRNDKYFKIYDIVLIYKLTALDTYPF